MVASAASSSTTRTRGFDKAGPVSRTAGLRSGLLLVTIPVFTDYSFPLTTAYAEVSPFGRVSGSVSPFTA